MADNKTLPERLRECARVQNVGVPYGQPVVVTLLREAAVALEAAEAATLFGAGERERRIAAERQELLADRRATAAEARVEAVEAENAELKAGGDRPEAVAVAQEVWIASPGADVDVIGHDGLECNPDCVACFFAAEASRYRKALREVENIAAQHAGVTPEAYEDITDVTRAVAVLASSVKQEKEGLGGQRSALPRAQEDQP